MGRCVYPVTAWQLESGEVVFAERGKVKRELTLPCGQCIECRLERSRQWAVRCMHEASLYEQNCFITLTYDDAHLPMHGSLVYGHFQDFMKRLRKKVACFDVGTWNYVPRFYMCGEYGEKFARPHFHACLFGYRFPDMVSFKTGGSGCELFTSDMLSKIWTDGFASVGELTFESAAYVARYCLKKVTGKNADDHYWRTDLSGECFKVEPEFGHMSLKPGIGAAWLDKFRTDVYPGDIVYSGSIPSKPPRFYDKRLVMLDPDTAEFMEFVRYKKSFETSIDSSVERLRAREIVTRARLRFKSRDME